MEDSALMELVTADPLARGQVVMRLIVEGAIDIDGDMGQAMKLGKVFSMADTTGA